MGDKFAVYEPIDGIFETYPTLEAAQKAAKSEIDDSCKEGEIPEEYMDEKLMVLQIFEVSRFRTTEWKKDYEARGEEWPFDDDFDDVGIIEMVSDISVKE
jgi:hypothetical protein